MNDIVERLRTIPRSGLPIGLTWNACDDAADEIERLRARGCARDQTTTQYCAEVIERDAEIEKLRAALREIKRRTKDAHPMTYVADFWRIANEALGEKE